MRRQNAPLLLPAIKLSHIARFPVCVQPTPRIANQISWSDVEGVFTDAPHYLRFIIITVQTSCFITFTFYFCLKKDMAEETVRDLVRK